MNAVRLFRHTDTSVVEQLLKNHFPASVPIYHRIRSPQNTPERQTLLLTNIPPTYTDTDFREPAIVSFVDRSRPNESQAAIFSTLCLRTTQANDLSQEFRQLLVDQLRKLLREIHDIGKGYAAADTQPLNYPFAPILRFTALHGLIADILAQDLAVKPVYCYEWDELIFSTSAGKRLFESCRLPDAYELGEVPPEDIGVVVETSKVKREASTLLANRNAAVLFHNPTTARRDLVAWAYLSIDQSLTTLYVLPEHRGKGLAKIVAGSLLRDLCDGFGDAKEKTQSDWCLAQVAADNLESQGVCKSLGASFHKRTVTLGFDLDEWTRRCS